MSSSSEETSVLKAENESLRARIIELESKLDKATKDLQSLCPARKLPPELLETIFLRTIPPRTLLDPGLCGGPDSPWCRTMELKKNLTLVCRAWHEVALSLLYEDVCIRRASQASDLLKTLQGPSGASIGDFVRSFDIRCYIPPEECTALEVDICLRDIMARCPRLRFFSYSSPCELPPPVFDDISFLRSSITHLRLDKSVPLESFYFTLAAVCSQLQSLRAGLPGVYKQFAQEHPHITFPLLERLFLETSRYSFGPELTTVEQCWTMPVLSCLTIVQGCQSVTHIGGSVEPNALRSATLTSFLSRHGNKLRFLAFSGMSYQGSDAMHGSTGLLLCQAALDACPRLTRLAIHPKSLMDDLHHEKLQWIDRLLRQDGSNSNPRLGPSTEYPCLTKPSTFPSLIGTRNVYDLPQYMLEWFVQFKPPSEPSMLDIFAIEMFHHRIIHYNGHIYFVVEESYPRPDPELEDIDDDEDPYISGKEISSGSSEEEGWEDDEEASSDEAFEKSQAPTHPIYCSDDKEMTPEDGEISEESGTLPDGLQHEVTPEPHIGSEDSEDQLKSDMADEEDSDTSSLVTRE